MNQDTVLMKRCLKLAQQALGRVAPNPLVGCVIVHRGEVIGEGYHNAFGQAHAEVNAINSVANKELLPYSTLYVNLEPCAHTGKTEPCVDVILKHQIPELVVGTIDPSEKVCGRGIAKLKEAGVKVNLGVLEQECLELNRRFFTFHTKKRPFVILKWAQTADGYIARKDNSSKWISSLPSRKLVHKWRAEEAAIMVGTNTVDIDNPELNVRRVKGNNPTRIILDRSLRIASDSHVFNMETPTIVFNEKKSGTTSKLSYIKLNFDDHLIPNILKQLHEHEILSMIVEGGAILLTSFIVSGLWDEARIFSSQAEFGEGVYAPIITTKANNISSSGTDVLKVYCRDTLGAPTSRSALC